MKTKDFLKAVEDKNVFVFVWGVLWRIWLLTIGIYAVAGIFSAILISIAESL